MLGFFECFCRQKFPPPWFPAVLRPSNVAFSEIGCDEAYFIDPALLAAAESDAEGLLMWGGLQSATRQCDSEVLKGLPDWTRSTSLHTQTHVLIAFQSTLLPRKLMSGLGGGWGVPSAAVRCLL